MRASDRAVPPLHVWGVTLLLSCVAVAALFLAWRELNPWRAEYLDRNRARLHAFQSTRPQSGTIDVIGVGSSSLAAAMYNRHSGSEGWASKGFRYVGLQTLVGDIADFRPLIGDILTAKPDLVLIEIGLVTKERRLVIEFNFTLMAQIEKALEWLLPSLGASGDEIAVQDKLLMGKFLLKCGKPRLSPSDLKDWWRKSEQMFTRKNLAARIKILSEFVSAAAEKGISVVLLAVPHAPLLHLRLREEHAFVLHEIGERAGAHETLSVWSPTEDYPNDVFCDFVHLNPRGAEMFVSWLRSRISHHFPSDSGP